MWIFLLVIVTLAIMTFAFMVVVKFMRDHENGDKEAIPNMVVSLVMIAVPSLIVLICLMIQAKGA